MLAKQEAKSLKISEVFLETKQVLEELLRQASLSPEIPKTLQKMLTNSLQSLLVKMSFSCFTEMNENESKFRDFGKKPDIQLF